MSRCARNRRVFFVEEPHFDLTSASAADQAPYLAVERVENGLHIAVPHLPLGLEADRVERIQQVLLENLIFRMEVRDPVLWFYTPMALGYSRGITSTASAIVYDCMDELSHFKGAPPELVVRERELFNLAHLVFTGGQSLYEAKRPHHPRVHAFPSSVDFAHFEQARFVGRGAEPEDQASIPHPRIGFFGVVDERMDVALIESMAKARADLHFVVIGPVVKIDPARLPRLPNIHWLGQKHYKDLPRYLARWDVAMMPFARNDATKFISPTKTLEYLAAGKPVVSTSIRDVVRPYGEDGLVQIADDSADFIAAIDQALTDADHHRKHETRDAFLAQTSWDSTWDRMNALVQEMIAAPRLATSAAKNSKKEEAPCSTI